MWASYWLIFAFITFTGDETAFLSGHPSYADDHVAFFLSSYFSKPSSSAIL